MLERVGFYSTKYEGEGHHRRLVDEGIRERESREQEEWGIE